MTLRLRLVIALVMLTAVGLAVFGVATYSLYARSEYRRVDSAITASAQSVGRNLDGQAGLTNGPGQGIDPDHDHDTGGPPVLGPTGSYAELRGATGKTLAAVLYGSTSSSRPKIPAHLPMHQARTVSSVSGGGRWRVMAVPAGPPATGDTVLIAIPLSSVESSLHHLVLIETIAALALLLALAAGSWFVLRRGLQPLETMADSAEKISDGDLSQRVTPSDGRTEVGQLGLALNTMLDEIESSFRERDATEQRLRQFLADASHELRTPLTSIQGFAELFRLDATNEHVDMPVIMRRIEEESARMRTLVEDLLLLARVDRTRTPEQEPVDLTVIAADAATDAVATAPDRPITVIAPEPVIVRGDRDHLRQAVANLVVNALKHTPAGSPVEIEASSEGHVARVVVRDHGPGLDDEAFAHAFDRFWQADAARAGTGVGLGLSIVTAIAEEHGGSAHVENATDGGARFTLALPAASEIDATQPATSEEQVSPR
ncbi:MAG TPA: HAMP domain-containing sensor histidine kinase [Acidimicrobiia bacterium]